MRKAKPDAMKCLERPLRTIYGLPRYVRNILGEEVTKSLVGKRIGDTLVVRNPDGKTVVLWRCRGCGTWWRRYSNWCKGCESWDRHVREMKRVEREEKARARRRARGGRH